MGRRHPATSERASSGPQPLGAPRPRTPVFSGPSRPRAPGDFCTHKSHQKALGRPQTPFVCPIGRSKVCYPVSTEFPRSLWLPRNRCGGCPTSPDGPRAEGCFLPHKIDSSIPSKGRQPKPDQIPATDQIPGGIGGSVAAQDQVWEHPIGQRNPKPWFWRFFGSLLCVQK